MPVLQGFANATSCEAYAALQRTLRLECLTDMTRGAQEPSSTDDTAVAIAIAIAMIGLVAIMSCVLIICMRCDCHDHAHCLPKRKSYGCYFTHLGPNTPHRRGEEHKPKPPHTAASIVMNDWNNKNDRSDSVCPQYLGARSAW
ncbi:hypothetical protein DL764_005922 [Monosporascus ibericus]|uniref:Uncharacterized protein n=1 Tax=Monosporascus ibericus TaxID=155417 RepID=A0A4Q4T6W5_9PEZI|nr:hypothetical protein DL764_005922 [Monosporascus ibericus]